MVTALAGLVPFQVALVVRDLDVAYAVESVEETTAQMSAAGHPAIMSGHSFGAAHDGVFAYYDTTEALGFVIEAVEPPGELPEPAFNL